MNSPVYYLNWFVQRRHRIIPTLWMWVSIILLSKKRLQKADTLDFSLVVMTGKRIHRMTTQMICSFCHAWNALPKRLIIVSDGTRTEDQIRLDFSYWKGDLVVADWKECLLDYSGDVEAFRSFAEQTVYGRKMAAMLHYAKHEPILFCDSDVLWFSPLVEISNNPEASLKMCEDIEPSYNQELIKKMGWSRLNTGKPMNVGIVYLRGDLVKRHVWFDEAIRNLQPPFQFPEQTILAAANISNDIWPISEINITLDDLGCLFSKKNTWVARHYVSKTKSKFWRDATAMNMKYLATNDSHEKSLHIC